MSLNRLFIAALAIGWCAVALAAEPMPRPSAAEIERATAQIQGIYDDKAKKARTPSDRAELAREIFSKKDSTEVPAERYALLTVAFNLASRGDDASLLLGIADGLKASFNVESTAALADKLAGITGPVNPATWPATAARINALINESLTQGEFAVASDLVTALTSLAKRARDVKTVAAATALRKTIAEKKKADDRFETLREAGSRADASPEDVLELARVLCFARNDWAAGLPLLIRSGDASLSVLAKAELGAADGAAKMAVADRWAEYAEKAPPSDRVAIREHAISIYNDLLPDLTGLAKVRVDEAVDRLLQANSAAGKDPNAWLVVFRSDKPDIWNTKSTDDPKNYAVPLDTVPPNVKYLRLRRASGEQVILAISKAGLGSFVQGEPYGWNGRKESFVGATMLGVFNRNLDVEAKTGSVAVGREGKSLFGGWGFGPRVAHGGGAEVGWNAKWVAREMLEISVTGRPLTSEEQRFLLQ
jgi:hypothetical protein